ncbi:MAG: protein translocase subunit SecF [Gammaproteobacteria bacterium]|nr:protein translocase subunit SecF [Gammaproteobacteria bacterium]
MEFFKQATHIDFLGARKVAAWFSVLLVLGTLLSLGVRGMNLGIDFTGGTLVEMGYSAPVDLDELRRRLDESEFHGAVVQYYGTAQDVLIRLGPQKDMNSAQIGGRVIELIGAADESTQVRRVEFVGAQVGEELVEKGGIAFIMSLFGILVYVALRFQTRFAIGAIVALLHDPLVTVGFFSLTQMEFDLSVMAAILAIIGYSLNDTIVVFDRVRENFRRLRNAGVIEVFNTSINHTLSRTIITGVSTFLVLLALLFWGGKTIQGFATALLIGLVVGTYSSVYVASPVCIALGITRQDMLAVEKEGAELPDRP